MTCLPWWPSHSLDIHHIKANSVSNILHFPERQLYCQYVAENVFVLDILKFNLPLFVIFYIHLRCTYHVRPAPILSICLFFLNLSLFLRFEFTWRAPIMTITDLPLFQTLSIILTCVYHVNNSLNMSPLTFYFHLACT